MAGKETNKARRNRLDFDVSYIERQRQIETKNAHINEKETITNTFNECNTSVIRFAATNSVNQKRNRDEIGRRVQRQTEREREKTIHNEK